MFLMSAILKIPRELIKLREIEGITVENDINIYHLHIFINPKTDKYNRDYKLVFTIPQNYPLSSPKVKFVSKIFHPNVNIDGKMCLKSVSGWSMTSTLEKIVYEIISLLKCPNFDGVMNKEAEEVYTSPSFFELQKIFETN